MTKKQRKIKLSVPCLPDPEAQDLLIQDENFEIYSFE